MSDKTADHSMPDSAFLTQEEVAKVLRVSQRHVANLQRKVDTLMQCYYR